MKMIMIIAAAGLSLSLGACNTPGERAVGGALIGGGAGALVGSALGGRRGALVGAGLGAAGGAVVGASSTPQQQYYEPRPQPCPYGTYRDQYGNIYCR